MVCQHGERAAPGQLAVFLKPEASINMGVVIA